MLSAAIILSERTEKLSFDSLQSIEGIEWSGLYCSNEKIYGDPGKAMIFSSPDILTMMSDVLIVLDEKLCNFEFLSTAIRKGCHLFLNNNLSLNEIERKELIHLSKEGNTFIQVLNDLLFQSFNKYSITPIIGTCFIEVRQNMKWEKGKVSEKVRNSLLIILKIISAPIHRVDVFCGTAPMSRPDVLNIHINFINGSTASVILTFTDNPKYQILNIYHDKGIKSLNFEKKINGDSSFNRYQSSLSEQINSFLNSIIRNTNPVFNLSDELDVYLLMTKIHEKFDLYSVAL